MNKQVVLYLFERNNSIIVSDKTPAFRNGRLETAAGAVGTSMCDEVLKVFGISSRTVKTKIGDEKINGSIVKLTLNLEKAEVGAFEVTTKFHPYKARKATKKKENL